MVLVFLYTNTMANRKIIDIEPKSKVNSQADDFFDDLPKITPNKKKRHDVIITVTLVIIAFLVASLITKYSSQRQPNIKSTKSTDTSELKFTRNSDALKTPEKSDASAGVDPFKPLTTDVAKEVAAIDATTKETITKNAFKIRLLNGNGITGDAAKIKSDLVAKGYDVGTVGNAKLKYPLTEIYYLHNYQPQADMVSKDLSSRKTELKEAEAGLIGANYNILVVIGKE